MRRPIHLAVCLVAVWLLAITGCREKRKIPDAVLPTVRAGQAEQIRPDAPERYSATILPYAQVDLAFKSAGLIEKIYQVKGADGRTRNVQAGDPVAEGTELAVVRKLDYEQRVKQAQDQTGQAEAQLSQAEAMRRQAEMDFTRAANLYKTASLTKPEYDQAQARLEASDAQVRGARAALENARTVVSEASLNLSDTSVRAPFSGWLTARNVERGSLVGNATPGFSMVDLHIVKAVFAIPDTSLKSVHLGDKLTVLLDAVEHPVAGVVTAISPQADAKTHVFSVEVSVANPRNEIRPGMIGGLTLRPADEPQLRVVIPLSAVVRAPGNGNAFAVYGLEERGGKTYAVAQTITVGSTFGNSVEVQSGIEAHQRVVVLGGELLRNGQEVRVLP